MTCNRLKRTSEVPDILTLQHAAVGDVRDSKHVWWNLVSLLPFVQLNYFLCVDRKFLVWVDYHTEQSGICLRK